MNNKEVIEMNKALLSKLNKQAEVILEELNIKQQEYTKLMKQVDALQSFIALYQGEEELIITESANKGLAEGQAVNINSTPPIEDPSNISKNTEEETQPSIQNNLTNKQTITQINQKSLTLASPYQTAKELPQLVSKEVSGNHFRQQLFGQVEQK